VSSVNKKFCSEAGAELGRKKKKKKQEESKF
jgi:hypothetical protein